MANAVYPKWKEALITAAAAGTGSVTTTDPVMSDQVWPIVQGVAPNTTIPGLERDAVNAIWRYAAGALQ